MASRQWITTVTCNAAIDKTYVLPRLESGKVNRAPNMYVDAGGKGLNVARVARQLGAPSLASGFVAGFNGAYIEDACSRQGQAHDFVQIEGESRLCLTMIDESTGAGTELIEPGPAVTGEDYERLKNKVRGLSCQSSIVCFSGSLPNGMRTDAYAELIRIAKEEGCRVLLDSSGEALLLGMEAAPMMIKPNEQEFEWLVGAPAASEEELAGQLLRLSDKGMDCISVSLGARGALVLQQGRIVRLVVPEVQAVNTVGCGDAFMAGLAVGLYKGETFEACLKLAAAAGTANALQRRAGYVDPAVVARLMEQIQITSYC